MFPIKPVRSHDLLHENPESPQEHCYKSRRTLMSPQEREIAWCTPNKLEMNLIHLQWLQSHSVFHIKHVNWLDFL